MGHYFWGALSGRGRRNTGDLLFLEKFWRCCRDLIGARLMRARGKIANQRYSAAKIRLRTSG